MHLRNLKCREFGNVRTLKNGYRTRSRWGRFGYRRYRSLPVWPGLGPTCQFVIKHRVHFDLPLSGRRKWANGRPFPNSYLRAAFESSPLLRCAFEADPADQPRLRAHASLR